MDLTSQMIHALQVTLRSGSLSEHDAVRKCKVIGVDWEIKSREERLGL